MTDINQIYQSILSSPDSDLDSKPADKTSSKDSSSTGNSSTDHDDQLESKPNMYDRLLGSRTYFGSDVSWDATQIEPDPNSYNCCLFMIVRNESRIITRCLDGVRELVDCVSICDTGSDDNTVDLIRQWGGEHRIPTTVYVPTGTGDEIDTTWRTFCYNRTQSFFLARSTYPQSKYYLTVDADMVLRVESPIDWSEMTHDGYNLDQTSDHFTYANPRIFNSQKWICEDYTHEAWNSPGQYPSKITNVWIDDRGDGGCKGDKSHRDVCFILCQMKQGRGRSRQDFYLANTYNDLGDYDLAIYWYWQRFNKDDWAEEKWFALYRIGQCYLKKQQVGTKEYWPHNYQTIDNYEYLVAGQRQRPGWDMIDQEQLRTIEEHNAETMAIKYLLEAYDLRPWRAEPLMVLCKYYRQISKHQLAILLAEKIIDLIQSYQPMSPNFRDSLIVAVPDHSYQPYVELNICAYYVEEYAKGIAAGLQVLRQAITMPRNNPVPETTIELVQKNLRFYWDRCISNEQAHRDKYENQIAYNYGQILLPLAQEPLFMASNKYLPWYAIAINAFYIGQYDAGERAISELRKMSDVPQNILASLKGIEGFYLQKRAEQRKQLMQRKIAAGKTGHVLVGTSRKAKGKGKSKHRK